MTNATPSPDPRPPLDDVLLYLTTQGTQLGTREGQYVVRDRRDMADNDSRQSAQLASFPVEQIETINIFGRGIDVTSPARNKANSTGTVINYFTTNGEFQGRFIPSSSSVAILHQQQHTLTTTEKLTIAQELVTGKIKNAIRYLKRKDALLADNDEFSQAIARAKDTQTLNELRGIEGNAAKAFYQQYSETLKDGWTISNRSRRPPEDHVNSLLSLTYTFLERETETALRQVNLDPYVGIFHTNRHGRPALALDLLEEFRRAFGDPLVSRLINQNHFSHADFTAEHKLTDDGFDQYIEQYDMYMDEKLTHNTTDRNLTRREVIRLQAHLLRKRITSDIDQYRSFVITQ
ncbi:CRISPR-associated endonuclease Cas1 [Salinarchaeum sp. IM2453]|uniref:CRISPR-associated endonuclease Cas1 n=1 Tax=Salinarchaeum sp. IM2453 TaxID=2862870 RepID=UPI001C82AC75|nr:CRISPR-associated endonuclease Cas1 [Salinarchaeum sp. IM2453]QZA89527.1 CRISPR-associated endonuclease Cas1 [Salinarchaeum sp. IM2453]